MKLAPWIETHGGKEFYFLDPTEDMIDIDDIAHSLSNQCRFSGHTSRFYSVAEHSLNVALELFGEPPVIRLQGLLHDASEAYLLDVPSPVKQYLTNYKEMEEKIMRAIFKKYGVPFPMDDMVKEADAVMLKCEARFLLPSGGKSWLHQFPTLWESDGTLACDSPERAKRNFLFWFEYLQGEVKLCQEDASTYSMTRQLRGSETTQSSFHTPSWRLSSLAQSKQSNELSKV